MSIKKLQRAIDQTRIGLAATGEMLKGSVNPVRLGKKKKSRGHRVAYLLTYKGMGNKTQSLYVAKAQVPEVTKRIRNYHKARRTLEKIVDLNIKLYKTIQTMKRSNKP